MLIFLENTVAAIVADLIICGLIYLAFCFIQWQMLPLNGDLGGFMRFMFLLFGVIFLGFAIYKSAEEYKKQGER